MAEEATTKPNKRATFAPLPVRAIGDDRLTASHFRALAAISEHDRLSSHRDKGAGCFASNKTLSEKCGINYSNFSTVVRQLGEWGYITSEPHPISKRTRVYRVIYDDNTLPTGKRSDDEARDNSLPTGKASPFEMTADNARMKPPFFGDDTLPRSKQNGEIVCPPNEQAAETAQHVSDKYIPLNGKRFSETVRNSSEEASLRSAEHKNLKKAQNDGAFLAITERHLQAGGELDHQTQQEIERIYERGQHGKGEDPNTERALRILEQWGSPI